MAYTPINWQTGDTITAEKMNKMDNGWSVMSGTTTLCDETVTTQDDDGDNVAYLSISETITAETIDVTFAGTKYTCTKNGEVYGGAGFDFTVYPFMLYDDGTIYTETAGTYTIKVEIAESAVETSADFNAAVNAARPIDTSLLPFRCVPDVTTYAEMRAAANTNRLLYFYTETGNFHLVIGFLNDPSATAVTAYPEGVENVESFGFNSNMVFTVFNY